MTLVPIPWQPHLYLTPRTLGYLESASARVGRNLYLNDSQYTRISPAWRSYAQQKTAWDLFIAKKGPVASNPDTGQRSHMRGAAFDLRETTKAVRSACAAVGLIPDKDEAWHWNDPAWASMPIIPTLPSSGGGGLGIQKEYDMPKLALDPIRKRSDGSNQYVVVGNGAPYDFNGTQSEANYLAGAGVWGATLTPTAAQWPSFIAANTPPSSTTGTTVQVGGVSKAELDAAVKAIVAAIPTRFTAT